MQVLVDHLEHRLGRMLGGKTFDEPSSGMPVAAFTEGVISNTTSFATIGLSNTPLHSRIDGRHLYLELVAIQHTPKDGGYGPLPSVLDFVAKGLLATNEAILHGDVVDLGRPIETGSAMASMYAMLPVYFDDDFKSVVVEDGRKVAIVWLIPIGTTEASFVRAQGWAAFEHDLIERDPDVLDLWRDEIL